MKYALNLSEDYHILSASFCNKFTPEDAIRVDVLPEGNIIDYKYINGEYVYEPIPEPERLEAQPSQLDIIEAQVT
jgi:hypothetical protein